MEYALTISNNTDSDMNIGLLDATKPDSPISIISGNGYEYVDVVYSASYTSGDSFVAVIGGTSYTVTLTSTATPSQVAALLTNEG